MDSKSNVDTKPSVSTEEERLTLTDYYTMLGKIGSESLKYSVVHFITSPAVFSSASFILSYPTPHYSNPCHS